MGPQQTIAHYRITAKLGEGGMGEVWRATDTKLGRDVAIKVLPPALADDAQYMARFEREAQTLAALNHPNIAAVYGVEQGALIMELVEGPNLAERVALGGALPLDEALPIARQIAEGLEAAHERGIVHRDLKPANIKITPTGIVKLLDFGLAKSAGDVAAASSATISPTLSLAMTQAGMILGTAAYMSPEQARGKPVDKRADVWAFGVVLYEMLTGRQLFGGGETITDTLASVVKDAPDLDALPASTPPNIRRLVERCLRKDPARRLRDIGEARIAIDEPADAPPAPVAAAPAETRPGAPWWMIAVAAVIPALLLGALLWRATRPVDRPLIRLSVDLGPDAVAAIRVTAVISPDGSRLVFPVRTGQGNFLATKLLDQTRETVLAGTVNGVDPFFSPDGQWIGFFTAGKLKKISVQGGAAVQLCDVNLPRGFAWSEDGYIYGSFNGIDLARVSAAGGTPERFTSATAGGMHIFRWPQILPGGDAILVTASTQAGSYEDGRILVYSLRDQTFKVVQRGGYFGRYTPSGHLLFIHEGVLFAVPFDRKRLETRGTPVPVVENVAANPTQASGQFDFSAGGTLTYLGGTSTNGVVPLQWLDKSGKKETFIATPPGRSVTPRLSPNGKLLAISVGGDIYIYDPVRGASTRITFDPSVNASYPLWMPDGKYIAYSPTGAHGIWWVRSDGSGKPAPIYDSSLVAVVQSVSPDGRTLAFHEGSGNRDIYTLKLDLSDPDHPKAGKPELFLATPTADVDPAFSPDGHWLAYASNESGSFHVFVRPFPEGAQGAGQAQVSSVPGRFPIWSRASKEIFYVTQDGHIMVAPYVVTGRAFSPGKPTLWTETPIGMTGVNPPLDLAPDGKRFVVFPGIESSAPNRSTLHLMFLFNFFDELKRRLP